LDKTGKKTQLNQNVNTQNWKVVKKCTLKAFAGSCFSNGPSSVQLQIPIKIMQSLLIMFSGYSGTDNYYNVIYAGLWQYEHINSQVGLIKLHLPAVIISYPKFY